MFVDSIPYGPPNQVKSGDIEDAKEAKEQYDIWICSSVLYCLSLIFLFFSIFLHSVTRLVLLLVKLA